MQWTPESARARLDADIRKAHEFYERRLAAIEVANNSPPKPTRKDMAEAARERRAKVIALKRAGLTHKKIAELVEMHPSHIGMIIRRENRKERWLTIHPES